MYSAHVQFLRKKYESLRKNTGEGLDRFLASPFEYPAVAEESHPPVPTIVARVGDADVL